MNYIIKHITTEQELDAALDFERKIFTYNIKNTEYTREKWLKRMETHGDLMLFAESDNKVVGIVFGRIEENNSMTIGSVATDEAYRGKGIARKLMTEIEIRAIKKGVECIALGAAEAAEGFYLRHGYTGSLLVQSEKHNIEELLAFSSKYPIKYTNIYDGTINQVCFDLDDPDRDLQRAYEQTLGDCWTQMVFGKRLLPETTSIKGYGKVCILNEYANSVKSAKGFMICGFDAKSSEIMKYLKADKLVILTGDYLRSYYIMRYIHHYENELSDGQGVETRRTRLSRLCHIAIKNLLVDVNGLPANVDFFQWVGNNTGNKPYLLPLRRLERIMTDIKRADEGIGFDFLKSKIYIKPFVYVPSDTSVPLMYTKYLSTFKDKTVVDIGTGTGILAILAAQSGATRVVAVDINPAAVACAKYNTEKSGLNNVIDVMESDLFENINDKFDIIIFNAPWVQGKPKNMYELAIYDNRFAVLKRFVSNAGSYLNQGGFILLQLSDISQQTDGSLDILYSQLELNGFILSNSSCIKRKNRIFGRLEKVYLFEITFAV